MSKDSQSSCQDPENQVTIYHNPRCSKSRGALDLLTQAGVQPSVVRYLDTPPDAQQLNRLLTQLDMSPRQLLRRGEAVYKELGLADPSLSDAELIDAMVANPKLIERPIVLVGERAVIARPPERVEELLALRGNS